MPPEATHYHPPKPPPLARLSPKSRLKRILHQKYGQGRMKLAKKKIMIPVLVFILCTASIFRFLNMSIFANFSVSLPSAALIHQSYSRKSIYTNERSLTEKETRFILELFSHRVPCNLLVFGSAEQYSTLAAMNGGGLTIFVEDQSINNMYYKMSTTNNTRVHKIVYKTMASEAYQLLKDARGNPDCLPVSHMLKATRCHLALTNLPREVYDTMWDVVVVDGPGGGTAESPGRMGSIFTAGMLARRGKTSDVVVHDVDRMIEKWFSWEFLCEDNLVSSKARFWHFRIPAKTNAS